MDLVAGYFQETVRNYGAIQHPYPMPRLLGYD